MRRRSTIAGRFALAASVGIVFGVLAPAGAGWINPDTQPVVGANSLPKFEPTARLAGGGSQVLIAGPLACTAKEAATGVQARIRVTLAQRPAKAAGEAVWQGACTKPRWKVTLRSSHAFTAGTAKACALGTQTKAGAVVDVLIWCQTIKLVA